MGSVGTTASEFAVGYVLWAIRSGFLLSSLIASMTAWSLLDPLDAVQIGDADYGAQMTVPIWYCGWSVVFWA